MRIAMSSLKQDKYVILQAATGSGKTIFFATLIKRLLNDWPTLRIAVLAHRRELIRQAQDKLLSVWPEAPIGIACASTGKKTNTELPVTIGSIQTLSRRAEETAPFDLIIIDEVHRLPPKNIQSQYGDWLKTMEEYEPTVRILGLTATAFRLGHGFCYGRGCKPGNENWFSKLHYKIDIKNLQKQGFLCGYRAKSTVDIHKDLAAVKSTGGEFNLGALSDLMSKEHHVGSAVNAYEKYGENRNRVVVFAVTIDHAEKLKMAFSDAGHTIAIVHSKMPLSQRDMALQEFEKGKVKFIISIGVLTEGWDSPAVDCVLMCRPTKSPALFVQMTGRGLRPHADKEDVLILDLANNCLTHGDPNDPIIEIPKRKSIIAKKKNKTCPRCEEIVNPGILECPACGYIWKTEPAGDNNGSVQMSDVKFKLKEKPKPVIFEISDCTITDYTSKKGNRMLKVALIDSTFLQRKYVNEFWQFDPDAHEYARGKARKNWLDLIGSTPPGSTAEAVGRQGEIMLSMPDQIEVIEDGNWLKIHSWKLTGNAQDKHAQDGYTPVETDINDIDDDIPF